VCACTAVFTTIAVPAYGQTGDTVVSRELAPGVAYRQFVDSSGPLVMYLVRVDLRRRDLELRAARAFEQLKGREKTTSMVQRAASG